MQRWLFRRELEKLNAQSLYYLDECGVDHRLYREQGRAPRGERIYEAVAGKRRQRTSLPTGQTRRATGVCGQLHHRSGGRLF